MTVNRLNFELQRTCNRYVSMGKAATMKKYQTAYNLFAKIKRKRIVDVLQLQYLDKNSVSKVVGRIWHSMSKLERRPYDLVEQEGRVRYLKALAASGSKQVPRVNPPPGYDQFGNLIAAQPTASSSSGMHMPPRKKAKVSRPLNCFQMFASQFHKDNRDFSGARPSQDTFGDHSQIIALRWKGLSEQEKMEWRERARAAGGAGAAAAVAPADNYLHC